MSSRLAKTSALVAHTPERFAVDVERASLLLAACRDVPSARDMRDKAKAAAIYLRAKKAGLSAQNDAREVMLRAERRMAELLPRGEEKAKGGRPSKTGGQPPPVSKTTLVELGIDKDEAKRLRQHRTVDDRVFEEHVRSVREQGEKLTLTKVAPPPSSSVAGYDGDESYTPPDFISDARDVMGGIDLDPFSNPIAQRWIAARVHYTKDPKNPLGGGLLKPWKGRCWFNPPFTVAVLELAVAKLLLALEGGDASHDVTDCVGVTNQSDAVWWHRLARRATAICQVGGLPEDEEAGRVDFRQPDGKGGYRETRGNRFAQTFWYFGSRIDLFEERFEKRGTILTPRARKGVGW